MSLKQSPRDFQVRELLEFEPDASGEFYVHLLRKQKLDTQEALSLICRKARVDRKDLAFAGLKDRQGLTEQFISVKGRRIELSEPGLEVVFKGRCARAIHSKMSRGNRFHIVLRGLTRDGAEWIKDHLAGFGETGYVNYFDDQRFGSVRHGQGFPMRDVLAGRYEKALQRLIARPSPVAKGGDTKLKELLGKHWGDWDACARIARGPMWKPVLEHLQRRPRDFAGAIQKLASRTRLIHSFAYQSYLWNRAVSALLEELIPEADRIPLESLIGELWGYTRLDQATLAGLRSIATPLWAPDGEGGDPRYLAQIGRWLASEQLDADKCRQNTLPGMVWREEPRDLLVFPTNLYANRPEPDGRQRGATSIEVAFSLPRGVYATMLMKHLFAGMAAATAPRGRARPARTGPRDDSRIRHTRHD